MKDIKTILEVFTDYELILIKKLLAHNTEIVADMIDDELKNRDRKGV